MISHSKPTLDKEETEAVARTLATHNIAQGEKTAEFEEYVSKYIASKGAVATNSGTSALHLALIALDVSKGDKVIIPSYVCIAVLNAINYVGAEPIVCDINSFDSNINSSDIKKKINKKVKAIILPHMFGTPANIENIINLGVPVIEDCAQSIGATYEGEKVGSFGILSIFSFYATKVITTGEGGMVLSNSKKLLTKIKDTRNYDKRKNYRMRFNYKMTDIQAAIGIVQLAKLPNFIKRRKQIADIYNSAFYGQIKKTQFLRHEDVPTLPNNRNVDTSWCRNNQDNKKIDEKDSIYFRYIIKISEDKYHKNNKGKGTPSLQTIIEILKKNGICTARPIFKPIHRYLKEITKDSKYNPENFPETEKAWRTNLSIPIYPSLADNEVKKIVQLTKNVNIQ